MNSKQIFEILPEPYSSKALEYNKKYPTFHSMYCLDDCKFINKAILYGFVWDRIEEGIKWELLKNMFFNHEENCDNKLL